MKLWTGLVRRLTAPEGARPLALFRMAVALAVLSSLLSVVSHGLVDVLWVDQAHGGYRPFTRLPWLVERLGGATPGVIWALVYSSIALSVALFIGAGGRLTALLLGQLYMALAWVNGHAGGSYDMLVINALWLVVLSPSTAIWSVDAWIVRGSPLRGRMVASWPRYLIIYQIVLVYWTTGLQKVSAYWVPFGDYSALYYIMQQPSWQRADMSFAAWFFPATQAMTTVSWWWEVLAPIWLLAFWFRGTRSRSGRVRAWFNAVDLRAGYMLLGLFFHVMLLIVMDVGVFPNISLAFYFCMFSDPEIRSMRWPRWSRWLGKGRAGPVML
ncbi:MAG: hypothetical protein ACI9MC_003047 [Kiritimatiellia bacterium]|jgi:hypothetical protein